MSSDLFDYPITRLKSKLQKFADGRVDPIVLVDTNPESSPVPRPQLLSAYIYLVTTAEIFWSRAAANTGIVSFEVQRAGQVLANLDSTSFYDASRQARADYVHSVTAIRCLPAVSVAA